MKRSCGCGASCRLQFERRPLFDRWPAGPSSGRRKRPSSPCCGPDGGRLAQIFGKQNMSVRRLAEIQPESFAFTPENEARCGREIAKYPPGRQASAIIPLLWRAQAQNEYWLSKPAIELVARMLDMPYIRALEIATFYSMFNLEPVGKYYIQLCGTTPCALRGSDEHQGRARRARRASSGMRQRRWQFLVDRSRMPRRLLQCADGADQR